MVHYDLYSIHFLGCICFVCVSGPFTWNGYFKFGHVNIVYVYSHNSAMSFLNLIKNYELTKYWINTNLMCIGEKTSAVLNEIKWKKIFLFNPGEEEFLLYKI